MDVNNFDSKSVPVRLPWTSPSGHKVTRKVKRFGYHNVVECSDETGGLYLALLVNAVNSVGMGVGLNPANMESALQEFPSIEVVIFNNARADSPIKARVVRRNKLETFLQSEFAPTPRGEGVGRCFFLDPRYFEMEATASVEEDADPVFSSDPAPERQTEAPVINGLVEIRPGDSAWRLTPKGKELMGFCPSYPGNPTLNVLIEQCRKSRRSVTIDSEGRLKVA